MTRFGLLVLFTALSIGPLSCGSGSQESATGGSGGSSSSGSSSAASSSGGAGSGGSGGNSAVTSSSGAGNGGSGGSSATTSSSGPVDPVSLIPGNNTISGWTVDIESNMSGTAEPATANTKEKGGGLIDGGIEPFYSDGFSPKLFIWQNYKNGSLPDAPVDKLNPLGATVSLYLFQMSSAEQASGMYKNLLKYSEYTRKAGTDGDWQAISPTVGDNSRIQDSNADWWINFQKGIYYVELKLTPSSGPGPDYTPGNENLKKEAIRFAKELAAKL